MTEHAEPASPLAFLPAAGGRIQRTATTITLATALFRQGRSIYQTQRARRQFEIAVPGDNELYGPVEQWLISLLPAQEIRSIEALASRWKNARGGNNPTRSVIASFDASIDQRLIIDGHPVRVYTYREQPTFDLSGMSAFDSAPSPGPSMAFGSSKKTIKIECKSAAARDHILKIMDGLLADHDKQREGSRCFVLGSWGDWNRRDFMTKRPLDTVYLPGTMRDDIAADLKLFLDSEEDYLRLGLPWHRGYMFSGEPGTGKTSLAKALASHFDLDIYVIALPDLKKDTDLTNALTRLEAPAIFLIEDIDVASAAHSREEVDNSVSLSGLLNALDGVGTPHGLITIMTSNHPEILDPALTRAGRVDCKLECPPMSGQEIRLMVEEILDIKVDHDFRDGIIAADVMEVLKRNMHRGYGHIVEELIENFG